MADETPHRLECEARYWLRQGYTTPDQITELRTLLSRRSAAALEQLIEEMRRQWRR
ncbi:DUF7696 family protein, partial [Stutzerimonas nosocomialis]|uniref:DUF7696 family protein n=1 Tax=Stutzerimonas nosocomialis TaxID=1056496 RepID=UPI0015757546